MTAGSLLTMASAALAASTVDGMYVADPTVGTWGCYEVTIAGDLVLYPYPQRAAWTSSAGSARADGHTILGWRGFYEIKSSGSVALQPFSDLPSAAVHEEACISATTH
jgi:hypothetical protein